MIIARNTHKADYYDPATHTWRIDVQMYNESHDAENNLTIKSSMLVDSYSELNTE